MTNIERNAKIQGLIDDFLGRSGENEILSSLGYSSITLMRDISLSMASIADSLNEIKEMYGRTPDDRRM